MFSLNKYAWWWNFKHSLQPAIQYEVITKLPEDPDGNYYDDFLSPQRFRIGFNKDGDIYETLLAPIPPDANPLEAVRVRLPVFDLGEILLVGRTGRELFGRGRKPSKWYVESERYWLRRNAVARARQVIKEANNG